MITDRECRGIDSDRAAVAVGRKLVAVGNRYGDAVLRTARRILRRRLRDWWRCERRWLEETGYCDIGEAGA